MSQKWVTSDHHFFHDGILEWEDARAALNQTPEEHWYFLTREWNRVVKQDDIVYHLGDFIWKVRNYDHVKKLNGKIRLVMGNHDIDAAEYLKQGVQRIYGVHYLPGTGVVLSHVPVHLDQKWSVNIHGHLHSITGPDDFQPHRELLSPLSDGHINVCVENTNWRPISLDKIIEYAKSLKSPEQLEAERVERNKIRIRNGRKTETSKQQLPKRLGRNLDRWKSDKYK